MADVIKQWWRRTLSDPQIMVLASLIAAITLVILFAGDFLAPILAALVIAYVLDGGIVYLGRRFKVPRPLALGFVYLLFLFSVAVLTLGVVPMLSDQIAEFLDDLPGLIEYVRQLLLMLPDQYPDYLTPESVGLFIDSLGSQIGSVGDDLLRLTLSSVAGFITALIYLVLVPLFIFFFLKDKVIIVAWFSRFMPRSENSRMTRTVWRDLNIGAMGYVRGKLIEIVLMWIVHWIAFGLLGLKYAPLLSFLVGLSTVVPFLGAAIVTIPIAIVGYAQWGFGELFIYLMIIYAILQFIDGNIVVPLLFSEVVKIHPIAIISAVLVFGNLWGIWGVFFAIPLATVVKAVLDAWPREGSGASPPGKA